MTSFLTLSEQEILMRIKPKDVSVQLFGGFDEAIRKIAYISDIGWDPIFDLVCLVSAYDSRFRTLSHRDILGTLMSLGIDRNQLGDFAIQDNHLYVFCKRKIAQYIMDSISMIGKCPVSFELQESVDIHVKMLEEMQINCASTRLDAVVAQLAHCSRNDAMSKIHQGQVKLNDVELEENRQLCFNDVVSIRKVGKFVFKEVAKTTKKNRLILKFEKFI